RAVPVGGVPGQALRLGARGVGLLEGDSDPWRIWIPARLSRRAPLSRRPHHADLRGHQRDPAHADRAQPGRIALASRNPATQPTLVWAVQMVSTVIIAVVIYFYFGNSSPLFKAVNPEWTRFGLTGILSAAIPALFYLRTFKRALNAD